MKWGLVLANRARRALGRASHTELARIRFELNAMTDDPYSGDTKMLKGSGGAFRRRVGEWRIIFDTVPERHLIVVTEIARRGSHTY
jgi:mRNA-degrading endonuclease RelE of RelBE toxin-antitoxin system